MSLDQRQNYLKSPSKLRRLWEYAMRLIAMYENFDERLTNAENKLNALSARINSQIDGSNV